METKQGVIGESVENRQYPRGVEISPADVTTFFPKKKEVPHDMWE